MSIFLASDWNKFQEITANLQKFISIDLVNYINSIYFTMDDVRNEIDLKINIFKTGELIQIIKDEVKKMGNFYTYIRPSATNYHSLTLNPISLSPTSWSYASQANDYKVKHDIWTNYDMNLFGYALFEADVTISGEVYIHPSITSGNIRNQVSLSIGFNMSDSVNFDKGNSLERCMDDIIFKNGFQTPSIVQPIQDMIVTNNMQIPTLDTIGVPINHTFKVQYLIRISPSARITFGLSVTGRWSNSSTLGDDFQGTINISRYDISFSNVKVYREKFIPPINTLGVL